ncbi:MAG: response regulator transcription factor [Candidatus Margulisiibacteriota bacterium]
MKRILVVDDAPEIGIMMEDVLAPYGYQIDSAPNASAAMERMRKDAPDLILLDVMMPGKNGFEFLEDLKQTVFRHIPVIMVTVKRSKEDVEKGLKLGVADYVPKPFDPDDLCVRIKKVLERRA